MIHRSTSVVSGDFDAFVEIMRDLCLAFDKQPNEARTRVFFESLKHLHIEDVRRTATMHRKHAKRFPTPKDLIPEKRTPVRAPKPTVEMHFSRYAQIANKCLMHVTFDPRRAAYAKRRAVVPPPIGEWRNEGRKAWPVDDTFAKVLALKSEYVRMAEQDEIDGRPWTDREFRDAVLEALETMVFDADKALAAKRAATCDQPSAKSAEGGASAG
jgi:hypothetical protein